jgi:prephenate dehydratase
VRDVVAFQGVPGAYSEQAIRQHFGDGVDVLPCPSLTELFEQIQTRQVEYGILPVENALAGAVDQAYELLLDHDLRIQAEVILHVHHALLAPAGTQLDKLQAVRSHPQALAQCEKFLKRNNIQPIPSYDTAGSARMISEEKPEGIGAIASALAGQLYKLDVLANEIEDVPFNYTRFFVLGHDDPALGTYNKTSLVFATRHRPAALYDCLGEFASRGLNLTKIESRPRRNRPWEPVFYVDVEGHWQDDELQEALVRILQRASFVKMLGSYPAVKTRSVGI